MTFRSNIFAIASMVSTIALAEPVVIYDAGIGQSTKPYLARGGFVEPGLQAPSKEQIDTINAMARSIRRIDVQALYFPLKSSLTPGKVISRKLNSKGVSSPMCLIGNDSLSRQWLSSVASVLANNEAVCLVTNLNSLAEYEEMQNLAPAVPMQPAKGDEFRETFGIEHYPFVISNGYIEQ